MRHGVVMLTNPLLRWMNLRGLDRQQMADMMGCDRSTISRLLSGARGADTATLARMSEITNCVVNANEWVAWDTERRKMLSPPKPKGRKKTAA